MMLKEDVIAVVGTLAFLLAAECVPAVGLAVLWGASVFTVKVIGSVFLVSATVFAGALFVDRIDD